MLQRKELNKLVMMTLQDGQALSAAKLYGEIQFRAPNILRKERVGGVKSLSKIINAFPEVMAKGYHNKVYTLRKYYGNTI